MKECPNCYGSGKEYFDCAECGGWGDVSDQFGKSVTCPTCKDTNCKNCNGTGEVKK